MITTPVVPDTGDSRARPGGSFILDIPAEVPAIIGTGDEVLHARGEALMIVGPDGVGKTTLAQRINLAMIGLGDSVLGLPVAPVDGRLLYLASDRPQQAARSMRRMVTEADRAVLDERLVIWPGPVPVDILADPGSLHRFVQSLGGIKVVTADSLKDMILGISEDKSGAAWNMARQELLAAGIELVEIHHQRKEQRGNGAGKPKKLADVYGSRWITAGAGSVALLWGEPGDPVVEFVHLKQPAAEVGPFKVLIDHETGNLTRHGEVDILSLLRAQPRGATAPDLARQLFDRDKPTDAEIEKVRRRLRSLVKRQLAHEAPATVGGSGGSAPARWFAVSTHAPTHGPLSADAPTGTHGHPREGEIQIQNSTHASTHATHADEHPRSAPFLESAVGAPMREETEVRL